MEDRGRLNNGAQPMRDRMYACFLYLSYPLAYIYSILVYTGTGDTGGKTCRLSGRTWKLDGRTWRLVGRTWRLGSRTQR